MKTKKTKKFIIGLAVTGVIFIGGIVLGLNGFFGGSVLGMVFVYGK